MPSSERNNAKNAKGGTHLEMLTMAPIEVPTI
jgi:hypothetical protein